MKSSQKRHLRKRLKEGALINAKLDSKIAKEWSAVDHESLQRLEQDELEDQLELRDPKVRAQIAASNRDYRLGRTKLARELLQELKAIQTASKRPAADKLVVKQIDTNIAAVRQKAQKSTKKFTR